VDASAAVAITAAGAATTVPTTSADFDRTWRRNCTTTQHKFVAAASASHFSLLGSMRLHAMMCDGALTNQRNAGTTICF
jgi:hypothetical protein